MSHKVKLRAPTGTDEVNFGRDRYRVENDGTVEVPEEAADDLLHVGGFVGEASRDPVPDGLVRMRHPDGVGCSFGGVSIEPQDGAVMVPCQAVRDLEAHGFVAEEAPGTALVVREETPPQPQS